MTVSGLPPGHPPGDDGPLLRPYVNRGPAGSPGSGDLRNGQTGPEGHLRGEVRPYLITGGRTDTGRVDVSMETVVQRSEARPSGSGRATFERAAVLAECDQPRSVAEVAARLHMPLIVALIVVGDLVDAGLLEASTTGANQAEDVDFLERLIDGVTSL